MCVLLLIAGKMAGMGPNEMKQLIGNMWGTLTRVELCVSVCECVCVCVGWGRGGGGWVKV